VNIDVLEDSMTDTATATDVDRSQNTEISAEYLAQLRELAESQGWSLDGTVRRALAVTRAVTGIRRFEYCPNVGKCEIA
jgi:hypothetical protein